MAIGIQEFAFIRQLVYEHTAIVLEPKKDYLVESRLMPLASREGLSSLKALIARLRTERFNGLHQRVIEAMTTNETSFFRDKTPFECLRKWVLPALIKRRSGVRTLNIWCAACASGQEPYSLAMLIKEHFPGLMSWKIRFLASDLSREILAYARAGCYTQLEVNRGLPARLLVKYFSKDGRKWRICDALRQMIDFRTVNLSKAWPAFPDMDIILMRNVMIYFDVETKKTILGKVRRRLSPGGYLFLGASETTFNLDDAFERVQYDHFICYRHEAGTVPE